MGKLELTERIEAPVSETFRAFTDFRALPERISGITKVEMVTDGPVGKGTRFRETRVVFGKEATEEFEVTEFEPDARYVMACDSCGVHWEYEHAFTPEDGGTRVDVRGTAEGGGLISKLMWGLMAGACRKALRKDMAEAKAAIEGG